MDSNSHSHSLAAAIFLICLSMAVVVAQNNATFTNPIFGRNSADPSVLKLGNDYYLTLSENRETELTIFKSPMLTSFRDAETTIAHKAAPGFTDLWASEMHFVNGELYIYFTMSETGVGHQMYGIRADDPKNPMGNWSEPTRLIPGIFGCIDGTPFLHGNGKLYFVWASFDPVGLSLWIAPMLDPLTVAVPHRILRQPKAEWDCHGGCTNEGPYFIYNRNVSYMIFSMSSTWDPNYALGQMSIDADQDPMSIGQWNDWTDKNGPVFWRNDEEEVYTTGHATFTMSPDETETWMVYHATNSTLDIDGNRVARIEKIGWNEDGSPRFPRPHGFRNPQPVPSGQLMS